MLSFINGTLLWIHMCAGRLQRITTALNTRAPWQALEAPVSFEFKKTATGERSGGSLK